MAPGFGKYGDRAHEDAMGNPSEVTDEDGGEISENLMEQGTIILGHEIRVGVSG